MPYPEAMVQPMRKELTRLGVEELTDAGEVDAAFEAAAEADDTMLLVINSVCGCAAANARPAVAMAHQHEGAQPDRYVTVFAGQDLDATSQARDKLPGIPPSSPFMALFKGGQPVFVIERRNIEGRSAQAIASDLVGAFGEHCNGAADDAAADDAAADDAAADDAAADDAAADDAAADDTPERPTADAAGDGAGDLPETFRSIT